MYVCKHGANRVTVAPWHTKSWARFPPLSRVWRLVIEPNEIRAADAVRFESCISRKLFGS